MRFFSFLLHRPMLATATLTLAGLVGVTIGAYAALERSLPPMERLKDFRTQTVTRILDRNGKELTELFRERRIWIPLQRLPEMLVNAILADGDERFLEDRGVRYGTLLSALFIDLRKGTLMQGGDTITGQVARKLLPDEERGTLRKIRETLLAINIEKAYTKEEIFEIYCNTLPLGKRARGFEAAAQIYFGKSVGELTLAQSALLAGLIRTPERDTLVEDPALALQRRDTILSRMAEMGSITRMEERAARREPLRLAETEKDASAGDSLILALVRHYLIETYGADRVFRQGLTVTTTIDKELQTGAESALAIGLDQLSQRIVRKRLYSDEAVMKGLLISLRPGDGEMVALASVGYDANEIETILAPRRTGGTLLPFVYLAAFESGYTLIDRVADSPTDFTLPGEEKPWRPTNRNRRYQGSVTLREALTQRLTVGSVGLLEKIGVDHVVGSLRRLGVASPLPRNLTLAAGESRVAPVKLVGAYGALANGGYVLPPSFIQSVATPDGTILEQREPIPVEAVDRDATYVLTKALEGAVDDGLAHEARHLDRPVAAMTGESDDTKDLWFIGYTPDLVTGVWAGLDRDRSLGRDESANNALGPVWSEYMIRALDRYPVSDFVPPPGVTVVNVDPASGKLASDACGDSVAEVFVKGTEPREHCRPEPSETKVTQ